VALLADDELGAGRETGVDDAYLGAGQVAGTLQLTVLPGLSRHGMRRAQIEGVRVAAPWRGQGLGRAMLGWAVSKPPTMSRP
jgi:GNAT superfamily N-acetyltransferase